jgi:hypothetical protein
VLGFVLPEIKMPDGNPYGFSLLFGRSEFADVMTSAKQDDVPIKPGEIYVFKIPEHQALGLEEYMKKQQIEAPKKVQIIFQLINFGDGTGFRSMGGDAFDKNKPVGCKNKNESRSADALFRNLYLTRQANRSSFNATKPSCS